MENLREIIKAAYEDLELTEKDFLNLKNLLRDIVKNLKKETTVNKS